MTAVPFLADGGLVSRRRKAMSRVPRLCAPFVGTVVLAAVGWRVGSGPFLAGLSAVTWPALAAAFAVGAVATTCSAWRWVLVARGVGLRLTMHTALPAYYRSQFLNIVLPGGVLGDVHRGADHGRHEGDVGRGLRAVVGERAAGQAVQIAVAVVLLAVWPSPVRKLLVVLAPVAVLGFAVVVLLVRRRGRRCGREFRFRWVPGARGGDGSIDGAAWRGILLFSAVVVAAHLATFVLAARSAGSTASLTQLLPVGIVVLLAMAVPLSLAGWGPREGAAALVFSATGLGAGEGIATTTAYSVLVLAGSLPGAVVLVAAAVRRSRRAPVADRGGALGA